MAWQGIRSFKRVMMAQRSLREFEYGSGSVEPFGVRTVKHGKIRVYDRLKVEPSTRPLVINNIPAQSAFHRICMDVIN